LFILMKMIRGIYGSGVFLLASLTALGTWAHEGNKKAQENLVKPKVAGAKLQYNRDIRPILSENCFACHGPDSASRKAGLRLDKFADAVAKKAIVPGNAKASQLIERITNTNFPGLIMPPATTHKVLTPEQKKMLVDWVNSGAKYEQHWSYLAPKMPVIPQNSNPWVRNPIDNFVFQTLAENNLKPAPEADKYTLARRVSLDLTGLPPKMADVEEFVQDKSPQAYEKFIDKYLAKPQWGEHRGRYWLDAARYGDTHGIHIDNFREMWSYRDWVIKAFNKNMPFAQFTTEQLAGDLLPNPTLDQRVATGFNRCNITTSEGGAIDEEYYVLYTRDRTDTMSQVFLGTTAGCAVCHDHKFDPLSQREFYSLAAFFNNTTQAAMDGNIQNTPPTIPVPMEQDRARFEALQSEITEAKKAIEARKVTAQADFEKWLTTPQPTVDITLPTESLAFHAPLDGKYPDGATLTGTASWGEGVVSDQAYVRKNSTVSFADTGDFESDKPFSASVWVKLPAGNVGGAVFSRMDEGNAFRGWDLWVEGMRFGSHLVNKWDTNALKVMTSETFEVNRWYHVTLTYDGLKTKDSLRVYVDGKQRATSIANNNLTETTRTTVPFRLGQRSGGAAIEGIALQDVRLYNRQLTEGEIQPFFGVHKQYLLTKPADKRTPAEKAELFNGWLSQGGDIRYSDLVKKQAALQNEDTQIRARGTIAHVSNEKKEEAMAYILMRGEYTKRGEKVTPITPAALPPMDKTLPKNRLGLAKWLLQPNHPLTYRVTVNRFWQEIFGQGLVRTTGDFGIAGELPSHPELLDWLALDFQRDGDIKRFYKQILLSATYRQSAATTPEKRQRDPSNRLLAHGPRFRMDAEMVRDYALSASGTLVKKIGGPSVKPYQPANIWEAVTMPGSNTRDYKRDSGDALYRRSLYTFWKRSAPPAGLEIFNAPTREVCTVRRERTNTPLQALATLNDEQYIEAARNLAQSAIRYNKNRYTRARYIAERLLLRPITEKEKMLIDVSLGDLEDYYNEHIPDAQQLVAVGESRADDTIHPSELAAYTMLANQLLNLDEVLNK
jgi:hypothetical protein